MPKVGHNSVQRRTSCQGDHRSQEATWAVHGRAAALVNRRRLACPSRGVRQNAEIVATLAPWSLRSVTVQHAPVTHACSQTTKPRSLRSVFLTSCSWVLALQSHTVEQWARILAVRTCTLLACYSNLVSVQSCHDSCSQALHVMTLVHSTDDETLQQIKVTGSAPCFMRFPARHVNEVHA